MVNAISEQVVVITGASSGIGLACAIEFAKRGAKVVLAARNTRDLNRAVQEIRRDGGDAIAVSADVSDYAHVQQLADRAVTEFGRIDTWINNAAVSVYGTFKQVAIEDVKRVMDTNFLGQVYGAKAALPHLESSGGALICVGSALSDRGVPLQGIYCASKHAIKGWLDSLRVELMRGGSKVRITLIKPSSINTPLFRKAKTYMGVEPQPIPPVYETELAVQAIVHAATHDVRDMFVGGAGKLLSLAERLQPAAVDQYLRWRGFEAQKTSWPKEIDGPTNLFAPVEHDGTRHGDFGHKAKGRSAYQQLSAATSRPAVLAALAIGGALLLPLLARRH